MRRQDLSTGLLVFTLLLFAASGCEGQAVGLGASGDGTGVDAATLTSSIGTVTRSISGPSPDSPSGPDGGNSAGAGTGTAGSGRASTGSAACKAAECPACPTATHSPCCTSAGVCGCGAFSLCL
jgi:hypothetical protein